MSRVKRNTPSRLEPRTAQARATSYVIGFTLSVIATALAYFVVKYQVWSGDVLVYVVLAIAVTQLVAQLYFFLHIGRGTRWKMLTFIFAVIIVLIVVIGTMWVMKNLDYNMMHMPPEEMQRYMEENQGL